MEDSSTFRSSVTTFDDEDMKSFDNVMIQSTDIVNTTQETIRSKNTSASRYPKRKKRSALSSTSARQANATSTSRTMINKLKTLYGSKVKPLEERYGLYNFCLPNGNAELNDSEFDAKPMVLLIGQYSTGKTTFIRHLVGGDYPSMHIGPEPTTDRFTALLHGNVDDESSMDMMSPSSDEISPTLMDDNSITSFEDFSVKSNPRNVLSKRWKNDGVNKSTVGKTVKGNSLTVMPELPFSSLSQFGSGFLSHFVGSINPAPLLEHVTLIDTPGVLSGEKQRLSRSYDFAKVSKWFADRADMILLLFDAHKLDISDELKEVIETIRPHNDDKIRCVLNKADGVTREQLVRVYGSLMFSMGKIFPNPEVVRVYTGSYWEENLVHDDFAHMFEADEGLLINELVDLPKSCAERKVNDVVKRIRTIKVHICILSYLKSHMPKWFGKKKMQEALIQDLEQIFDIVRIENNLSEGDFPDVHEFRKCLREVEDFSTFITIDKKALRQLDKLLSEDIPSIMKGTAGITDHTTPRKTPIKISKTPRKGIEIDLEAIEEEEEQRIAFKRPRFEKPKDFTFYAACIVLFIMIAYVALYVISQSDPSNTLGLSSGVFKHYENVSRKINAFGQFFESNIYSSKQFEL